MFEVGLWKAIFTSHMCSLAIALEEDSLKIDHTEACLYICVALLPPLTARAHGTRSKA